MAHAKPRTPLCDALAAYAAQNPLRMHMPGHKGKGLPLDALSSLAPLDVTELTPTGDLYAGDGPIEEAEALWAGVFGIKHCLFLTGGSTQGIHAALTLAAAPGGQILLDRCSHRAAYHSMALLDLHPVYLHRSPLPAGDIAAPVSPAEVEAQMRAHPAAKAVCIVSPTYYGVRSDLSAIASVVHRHGGTLIIDAAHGAHLPFLGDTDLRHADLVVTSAHKTLPAMGQSALLFSGDTFPHAALRTAGSIYGSSSPSYPIMASLDSARAYMEESGTAAYRQTAAAVARLRGLFPSLMEAEASLDPCRLTLRTQDGHALLKALEDRQIYAEMADSGHIVFILTCADGAAELDRLEHALSSRVESLGALPSSLQPPPLPELVLSPRQALFSAHKRVPLADNVGRICAEQIAPYPPGIPLVAPGERLTKKIVAYLTDIGYNETEYVAVVTTPQGIEL
ncbi:MAG: aminotransferase class V-fold PLP-dependent enzyme [Oscillospiraceae bacterium]|nr:aminotransferase class V-fold PLP-dependent enzyme [Oscillospiraceae bacterium]